MESRLVGSNATYHSHTPHVCVPVIVARNWVLLNEVTISGYVIPVSAKLLLCSVSHHL